MGITRRIPGPATSGQTARVSGVPGGGATSRVHHLLQLEGDEAGGFLLLEGDAQSGDDVLKLEGDAATVGVSSTSRVSGSAAAGSTSRIVAPTFALLLAGDQQSNADRLLLAGDQQGGSDVLIFGGDQQDPIKSNATKRVTA